MKTKYHIIIDDNNRDELELCLKKMGVGTEFVSRTHYGDRIEAHYLVSLTKYELLYLRLACTTTGKVIDVDAWELANKKQHEIT